MHSPSVQAADAAPAYESVREESMFQHVAFRPLHEIEIHNNDKKYLEFYAGKLSIYQTQANTLLAAGSFMLRGVVTLVKYVQGIERDSLLDTPPPGEKGLKANQIARRATHDHVGRNALPEAPTCGIVRDID